MGEIYQEQGLLYDYYRRTLDVQMALLTACRYSASSSVPCLILPCNARALSVSPSPAVVRLHSPDEPAWRPSCLPMCGRDGAELLEPLCRAVVSSSPCHALCCTVSEVHAKSCRPEPNRHVANGSDTPSLRPAQGCSDAHVYGMTCTSKVDHCHFFTQQAGAFKLPG